ncbi:conjugative transposon protein TraM [Chitinophaga rhizophila]|uniref:Conjugative transposon protein TraM n=1 Tax=Chitinophaga rhizophila TaxID=2866212 RepID=A0ABS7G710_9BACT|nr:conjugative transposon protein TraM [Chitinophaga rhizophila]MBW8683442.1 conjugative transposon protein TraM [Chitinophaga rhizophila]
MKQTETFLRKRRFLTIFPVLIYPFLCLIFWGLGGGQVSAHVNIPLAQDGLNKSVPGAQIQDRKTDMLSLYDKAARDSAKLKELREIESKHWLNNPDVDSLRGQQADMVSAEHRSSRVDATEAKVNERLAELQKSLDKASSPVHRDVPISKEHSEGDENLKKMEQLLSNANQPLPSTVDPEIKTLNGMLDKILDIQHPERTQLAIKEQSKSQKGKVFTFSHEPSAPDLVIRRTNDDSVYKNRTVNRFYAAGSQINQDTVQHNAIRAIIYEGGKFTSGSKIKMLLQENVYLNGTEVPKGSFVFGFCEVQDERLKVRIESIGIGESIFKVSLSVYDNDAQEGISAPGAITRNEVKAGASSVLQSLDINSYDPSLGAQAANAGIATAKSLAGKKTKMVYASIKAGRKIFLLDDTEKR